MTTHEIKTTTGQVLDVEIPERATGDKFGPVVRFVDAETREPTGRQYYVSTLVGHDDYEDPARFHWHAQLGLCLHGGGRFSPQVDIDGPAFLEAVRRTLVKLAGLD